MVRFRVKEIATEKGISQNMIAHYGVVDVKTVRRLFREPHPDVSIYTLEKVARALGVKVRDLFVEDDEDSQGAAKG
jgi:DNA-binding Xre family transcriptional regulator